MSSKKVPGPLLTSKIVGGVDLTPPKWRAKRGVKITDQENPPEIEPEKITGVRIESKVIQVRTNERKKTNTELTGDLNAKFVTKKLLPNGQIATRTETYPLEGTDLVVSDETIDADQDAKGDGHIEQTVLEASLPGPTIESSRIDPDGKVVQIFKTRKLRAAITEGETLGGGNWAKTTIEGETDTVGTEVVENRAIPGNPVASSRIDDDGIKVTVVKTLKDTTAITESEAVGGGFWTKTYKEPVGDKVANEVVETRAVPGNPVPATRLDPDGIKVDVVRTLKVTATIVPAEGIASSIWTKTTSERVSDLVSYEIVEARLVNQTNVIPAARITAEHEIETETRKMRDTTTITPSVNQAAGSITTVEKDAITDKVSWEVTKIVPFFTKDVYEKKVPESIIPLEFRATIPYTTESHIVAGTAAMPTLGASEFLRRETQLTTLLKEVRFESLGTITLPIVRTGTRTTEDYGGEILNVVRTLDSSTLTADSGPGVVSSNASPLGNGMWFKETHQLSVAAWPVLTDKEWDGEMQSFAQVDRQVVGNGFAPSSGTYFVDERKQIDQWRVWAIRKTRTPTATGVGSALISNAYGPFQFPGLLPNASVANFKKATAQLVKFTIKTWWESGSMPTPTVNEIITGSSLAAALGGGDTIVHDVLYDAHLYGTIFFPATTPSYSTYAGIISPAGTLGFTAGSINVVGTGTAFTTDNVVGDILGDGSNPTYAIAHITDNTHLELTTAFPFTVAGIPSYWSRPSIAWRGSLKVVGANITATDIPNLWKVQTKSVIMR